MSSGPKVPDSKHLPGSPGIYMVGSCVAAGKDVPKTPKPTYGRISTHGVSKWTLNIWVWGGVLN